MSPSNISLLTSSFPKVLFQFIEEWFSSSAVWIQQLFPPFMGLPFIIFIFGVAALIIYALVLIIRGCCCFELPSKQSTSFKANMISALVFVMLGIITINITNIGISQFEKGSIHTVNNVEISGNLINDLSVMSKDINNITSNLIDLTSKNPFEVCPIPESLNAASEALSAIFTIINTISSALNGYATQGQEGLSAYPEMLYSLSDALLRYSSQMILAWYILYGIIFAYFLLLGISITCKSSNFTQFNIAWGWLIILFLTITCCTRMVFIPVVGTYCLDPQSNTERILFGEGSTPSSIQTFQYFTQCPIEANDQYSQLFDSVLQLLDDFESSEVLLKQAILKAVVIFSSVSNANSSTTECSKTLTDIYESVRNLSTSVRMLVPGNLYLLPRCNT